MRLIVAFFLLLTIGISQADEIDDYFRDGQYNRAYNRLRELYGADPGVPEHLFLNGKVALSGENSASYLKDFINKSADTYLTDWARLILGKYYLAQHLFITARKQLESIPESSPFAPQARYLAARCYLLSDEHKKAASSFEYLINQSQDEDFIHKSEYIPNYSGWIRLGLADTRLEMKDYLEAHRLYRELLKPEYENDIFALALLGLAEIAKAQGDTDDVARYYDLYNDRYQSNLTYVKVKGKPRRIYADKSPGKATKSRHSRFYIQVGAFSKKDNALRISSLYKNSGYNVYMETFIEGGKEFYRILVGGYNSNQQAEFIKNRLEKSAGEKYLLIER
ncbi:MAG: tetratricopeptide repeat protein [candidate division Zixibacteria bacterium]|nr:tetratricopeptide repeat protein [candidate division Zixibacteria bacterium]